MCGRGTTAFKEEKVRRWVGEGYVGWWGGDGYGPDVAYIGTFSHWCKLTLPIVVLCIISPAALENVHSLLSSRILPVYAAMLLLEPSPRLCWPILRNLHQIRRQLIINSLH